MDQDQDLRDFSGVVRLFPLPRLVFFPHVVLPLHIFEPRYRQMTEDALAGDRRIAMIQSHPRPEVPGGWPDPVPIEAVGCLGRIIRHERLVDGRFNMLLLGRKRVRLVREVPSGKLYRTAEVEVLEDVADPDDEALRADLIEAVRRAADGRSELEPVVSALLETSASLGVLTDIVAHALAAPPEMKQALLGETSVRARFETLHALLLHLADANPRHRYPPDFSAN